MEPVELICGKELLCRIRSNLSKFEILNNKRKDDKHAAVAITIVDVSNDPGLHGLSTVKFEDQDAALILTRRSSKLNV